MHRTCQSRRATSFGSTNRRTRHALAADPLEWRVQHTRPITQGIESFLFAEALRLLVHIRGNPPRERNLPTHMPPRGRVLFSNLRNLIWRESFSHPDQRRPETAMDQCDLPATSRQTRMSSDSVTA